MKKLFLLATFFVLLSSSAEAQNIRGGDFYFRAGATGVDFSFSDKMYVGLAIDGGYFVADNWAIGALIGINHYDSVTGFSLLANVSHYFLETDIGALFGRVGLGLDREQKINSFVVDVSAGYSIFVTDEIAIEPTAGFLIPFKNGRDASFRLGVAFSLYF